MASMIVALRQYLHEILTLLGDDKQKLPWTGISVFGIIHFWIW